jgi:hypothetical protein
VLGLIALFTHEHIFWIAGLLLTLIEFPNFGGLFGGIAGSIEKMAGGKAGTRRQSTRSTMRPMAGNILMEQPRCSGKL